MVLTVKSQILLPLIVTILVGVSSTAIVGFRAVKGQQQVEAVVNTAIEAKSLATKTEWQFQRTDTLVKNVLTFTTFVDAKQVKDEFESNNAALEETLATLRQNELASRISADLDDLISLHATWRDDARSALGLASSAEIPTEEKLQRNDRAMTEKIQQIAPAMDKAASSQIQLEGQRLSSGIIFDLGVAAVVSLLLLAALYYLAGLISRPIITVTHVLKELAAGNDQVVIPSLQGSSEIRDMIGTVDAFKAAAIHAKTLESDARTTRDQAEQNRLADQAAAERDAAARLQQATSGLAAGLKRLASGDLAFQLEDAFSPEFEPLRRDFNTSLQELGNVLLAISSSTDTISGGSHNISKSADQLAARTEQQAAALEQTAAALDEITANVTSSAKRTEEARQLAVSANSSAGKSGDVVARAVSAMSRIEESSRQISSIIGVIDQIAFQTNLLALNAGVEAARAGDAGKGFAVVAQEVRELAQRSATAAKEIKTLIQVSTDEVNAGVMLVSETGDALRGIGEIIGSINEQMEAIALSSREQSVGLAEVNTAVNRMDQVTQQNAAMVEEVNASSQTLADEAVNLQDMIHQFQLADTQSRGNRNPADMTHHFRKTARAA